jgi:hypothetical protein
LNSVSFIIVSNARRTRMLIKSICVLAIFAIALAVIGRVMSRLCLLLIVIVHKAVVYILGTPPLPPLSPSQSASQTPQSSPDFRSAVLESLV